MRKNPSFFSCIDFKYFTRFTSYKSKPKIAFFNSNEK